MYHVYTVDEHTLFAIGILHQIETGQLKEELPVATAIIAALIACAAVAWLLTAQQSASMAGMGGMAMLGAGLFLVIWVVMMVAMMFPSITPMVLTHARIVRSRGEGTLPTVAFVLGFLVVWSAAGLVPLAVIQVLGASLAAPINAWLPRLGGAVVVLAGVDVEGYLRASEFSRDRVDDLTKHLKEGDTVQAMIINVDRKNRSINLSVKAKDLSEETDAMKALRSENAAASAGATNLGALLRAKLDKGNTPSQ